ncbi:MAG: glycoside hydrolase family 32 protein [Verrucomicrobia bacterium]|nr:glycoside hydrolase family 32 protein [Verrucomicrobiota bacterium]
MKHPIHTFLLAIAAAALPLSRCPAAESQPANAPAPQGFECPKIDKPFVHLPIKYGAPKVKLLVKVDGELQHAIFVNLAHDKADWNGTFTVDHWMGKKLTIVPENPTTPTGWIRNMKLSDQLSDEESVYKEKHRPQFHFTGRRGWINDVNGTFYLNGTYHLMFQAKPWQTEEGDLDDVLWGHAVSKDLVHWQELGSSARLGKLGSPFSGSAVVDWYNTSGLVKDPIKGNDGRLKNPAALLFYATFTSSPSNLATGSFTYSLDSGKTWTAYAGNPVIVKYKEGNRDPKVFWYDDPATPSNSYWVFLIYSGQDETYGFFTSKDLIHWEPAGEILNAGGSECPDMLHLPLDGDKNQMKWVFWAGNSRYSIGSFDGKIFHKESGPHKAAHGGDPRFGANEYAAQTFANIPPEDGRCLQFAWMIWAGFPTPTPFQQNLTILRDLSLRTTPDGPRLFIEPAKEIEKLRTGVAAHMTGTLDGTDVLLKEQKNLGELVDLLAEFTINKNAMKGEGENRFGIEVNGQRIVCDLDKQEMDAGEVLRAWGDPKTRALTPLGIVNGKVKLRVLVDRMSVEVFANDGAVQIARCFLPPDNPQYSIKVFGKKCLADVELKAWQLQSIWKK